MPTETQSTPWTIVLYIEDNGKSPVEEFIRALDERAQARLRWVIEQLRIRNVTAREPLVKHLQEKIYEVRLESHTNTYRVMYFFATGRRIVLLHGFQKKTQKTPSREIALAMTRMSRFVQREGGGS